MNLFEISPEEFSGMHAESTHADYHMRAPQGVQGGMEADSFAAQVIGSRGKSVGNGVLA